jgi:hypothetical protein
VPFPDVTIIRAALDACVLFPATLRDTLLGAAFDGLFIPSWSAEALDEMTRNLVADGRATPEKAARTVSAMRRSFPAAEVAAPSIPGDLPGIPADDRHIAAAAVVAGTQFLVTSNLQHFPAETLAPFNVLPVSPDTFLSMLYRQAPAGMAIVVAMQQAKLRNPPLSMDAVLQMLAITSPGFVELVRTRLLR